MALEMVERKLRICQGRTVSRRLQGLRLDMLGEDLPDGGVHPAASGLARSRPHPTAVLQLISGLGQPC